MVQKNQYDFICIFLQRGRYLPRHNIKLQVCLLFLQFLYQFTHIGNVKKNVYEEEIITTA